MIYGAWVLGLKEKCYTTTTKPYPTKWGRLHGSNYAIVFYHKSNLDPTH